MSDETLQEMQNRWHLLMAAKDPKTGERIAERDLQYRRECFALGVQIEERKKAEASRPSISQTQLDQLAWLDRMTGAKDSEGRQIFFSHDTRGAALRESIGRARTRLADGQALSQGETESIRQLAQTSGAVSYPERVHSEQPGLLPPATFNAAAHSASQPIYTQIGPKA